MGTKVVCLTRDKRNRRHFRIFSELSNYEIRLTVEGEVEGFACFAFGLKKLRACLYASSLEKIRSSKF